MEELALSTKEMQWLHDRCGEMLRAEHVAKWVGLVHSPHLLVRATNERFLPGGALLELVS
jgi:hypothetical protein